MYTNRSYLNVNIMYIIYIQKVQTCIRSKLSITDQAYLHIHKTKKNIVILFSRQLYFNGFLTTKTSKFWGQRSC